MEFKNFNDTDQDWGILISQLTKYFKAIKKPTRIPIYRSGVQVKEWNIFVDTYITDRLGSVQGYTPVDWEELNRVVPGNPRKICGLNKKPWEQFYKTICPKEARFMYLLGGVGSGLTTVGLGLAAHLQRLGTKVAYLDLDLGFSSERAEQLGVDSLKMAHVIPERPLMSLEGILLPLIREPKIDFIIVDTVRATHFRDTEKAATSEDLNESIEGIKTFSKLWLKVKELGEIENTRVMIMLQARRNFGDFECGPTTLKHITTHGAILEKIEGTQIRATVSKALRGASGKSFQLEIPKSQAWSF